MGSRQTVNDPSAPHAAGPGHEPIFWRVEGSLLDLTAVRPVGFFTWNAQTFLERWARRGTMGVLALARPVFYATDRVFATRVLHTVLRDESRDRLDLLGEEFFHYFLKPRLKQAGVEKLKELLGAESDVVLVSQGLDHIMRPLAAHLGVRWIVSNRLDFRDGLATGRLLDPVIRPRGLLAKFREQGPDGTVARAQLVRDLGFQKNPEALDEAIRPAERTLPKISLPVVRFDSQQKRAPLSVREALRGKKVLLIGGTGFIGKVWLANLLTELPEIGRIYLLVRGNKSATALERFERIVEESPVFDKLAARHGENFADFLRERVEVLAGDGSKPNLGLTVKVRAKLARSLDLIVNSSGLTDFNPDLRDALASNVRSTAYLLEFLRECRHAALLHLSTCYAVGKRDGRVLEYLPKNYTPSGAAHFNAVSEWRALEALVADTEERAESPDMTEALRRQALEKKQAAKDLQGAALENQIRKNRVRWLRQTMMELATRRANATWLAEHVHVHEEPFRIADSNLSRRDTGSGDRGGEAVDRGIVDRKAISGMERGDQHIGVAFLSAGHLFPAVTDEREQVPGPDSGGCGLAWDDADRGGAGRAAERAAVSSGDVGGESVRHAEVDRADGAGAPEILSRAERLSAPGAAEIRRDSRVEGALRPTFGAGAEDYRAGDQPERRAAGIHAAAAGATGARTRKGDQADRALRAVHSAQRSRVRGRERGAIERGAARGRGRGVRLRRAIARLVGLLDQRAHSGAAQVVLSSDRGPSAGSAPATQRAADGSGCDAVHDALTSKQPWPSF